MIRRGALIAVVLAALFALASSCSRNDRFLQFFFDVPSSAPSRDAPADTPPAAARAAFSPRAAFVPRVVHSPFKLRQCMSCHDPNQALQPPDDLRSTCAACHADAARPLAYMHGPVAAGACTACHSPHAANHSNLLRRPDPALCQYCHAPTQSHRCSGQTTSPGRACTSCHDPHASDFQYLLKSAASQPG